MDFYFAKICSYRRRVDDVFLRHAGEMGSANGNPDALEAARASCRQAAEQRYPVSLSLHASSPAFSSMTINGTEIPNAGGGAFPSDSNAMRRTEHVNACMKLEGWENKNKVTGLLAFLFN
ncbi:hypothetical protein M8494_00105 [Serratia ureilytica]